MAVDTSSGSTGLDLNSLLQSAIAGGNMSNIFGSDASGVVMGLLLGRLGLFGNGNGWDGNQNSDRAAIDSAVSAALANANQANNNFGILLKDIQDSSQDVVAAINNGNAMLSAAISGGNQVLQQQVLQGQIANLQGQSDIKSAIAVSAGNIVNEIHETETTLLSAVTSDGDKTRAAIAALAANIPTSRELDLQRQLAVAQDEERFRRLQGVVDSGNVTVTNNINQNQLQQQQQQQILNLNGLVSSLLAEQRVTQGILNIGSGTVAGTSQNAANTRVA